MTEKRIFQVAVDGPSGAGKSTVAKALAKALGVDYIDTGAMYRAVAYKMKKLGISGMDTDRLREMLADTEINFSGGCLILDGAAVDREIRNHEISGLASKCSALPEVREKLVALQRRMGEKKSAVMDGRDIASNVFPNAAYKFFLTASPGERVHRRYAELKAKGEDITPEAVYADIERRDYDDSHRSLNPLLKVEDAVEIDTGGLSPGEVTEKLMEYIRKRPAPAEHAFER